LLVLRQLAPVAGHRKAFLPIRSRRISGIARGTGWPVRPGKVPYAWNGSGTPFAMFAYPHPGLRMNALFVDGHVEPMSAREMGEEYNFVLPNGRRMAYQKRFAFNEENYSEPL
jgi:prepilin-type processing-associated H-X9-DG protein